MQAEERPIASKEQHLYESERRRHSRGAQRVTRRRRRDGHVMQAASCRGESRDVMSHATTAWVKCRIGHVNSQRLACVCAGQCV